MECLGKTGQLFSFHDNPNPDCPVGANIHGVLDEKLDKIQEAMEEELSQTSLVEWWQMQKQDLKLRGPKVLFFYADNDDKIESL